MRAMLDTHVFLWMMGEPERLHASARAFLDDSDNRLVLSAASAWEIAIKHALDRLALPVPPQEYVTARMREAAIEPLVIEHRHALSAAALPVLHRDPFDRLLIAQAQFEQIPIMTADRAFAAYDVEVIAA